jgi:hypothetical protein
MAYILTRVLLSLDNPLRQESEDAVRAAARDLHTTQKLTAVDVETFIRGALAAKHDSDEEVYGIPGLTPMENSSLKRDLNAAKLKFNLTEILSQITQLSKAVRVNLIACCSAAITQ